MKARELMSSPVIFLRPRVPADVAAALLVSHGFTSAPVVDDDGYLVGIATEADLVRGRFVPDGWTVDDGPEPLVSEVMTHAPVCLRPEDDVADIVSTMLDAGIRSVPIVDDGRLVGIVSRRDVLRVVARGGAASLTAQRHLTTRSDRVVG
jgi:CBS domain-containing protein